MRRRSVLKTVLAAPFILRSRGARSVVRGGPGAPADPITQVLATMSSKQSKKLTGVNQGSFSAAQQVLTLTQWDPGGEGAPQTWAADANVSIGGVGGAFHGVTAFSAAAIRDDGEVNMWGGGHADGGDNAVIRFSSKGACQAILAQGGSQNWSLLVPGGFYIRQANAIPATSSQNRSGASSIATTGTYNSGSNSLTVASITTPTNANLVAAGWAIGGPDVPRLATVGSVSGTGPYTITLAGGATMLNSGTNQPIYFSLNAYFASTNSNGDLRTHSAHSYWMCLAFGLTGKWGVVGIFGFSPIADSSPGNTQEIVGDNGRTQFTSALTPAFNGYSFSGTPLWCDLDSKVYCWQQNGSAQHLYQVANPTTTTPTVNDLGAIGNGTDNPTVTPPCLINYPDNTHRAIYAPRPDVVAGRFELCLDITGTPSNGGTFTVASVPTFPGAASPDFFYDAKRKLIKRFDGSNQLSSIDIFTAGPSGATWTLDAAVTGDQPSVGAGNFVRGRYLPVQDAYLLWGNNDVWLVKP